MSPHSPQPRSARCVRWLRGRLHRTTSRALRTEPGELPAVLWSAATFFTVLATCFVLRPIRETLATELGVQKIPYLMTGTFAAMLVVLPIYSAIVARWPRRTAVPWIFRFFIANLAIFAALFQWAPPGIQTDVFAVFYVWVSVFNLFVVSVFWSMMAELFRTEQSTRLFGPIAAGGSLGGLTGSMASALLSKHLSIPAFLCIAIVILEVSIFCRRRVVVSTGVGAHTEPVASGETVDHDDQPIGGTAWSGFVAVIRSPVLASICGFIFLGTVTATVVYAARLQFVATMFETRVEKNEFFAMIDFVVQGGALVVQLFLVSRILRRTGVAVTLAILPIVYGVGMISFTMAPSLGVIVALEIARRVAAYAVAKPTMDILYTLVTLDEKYKAKGFIDLIVYRGGDVTGAWLFGALFSPAMMLPMAVALGGTLALFLPFVGIWLVLAAFLGHKTQQQVGK